MLIMKSIETSLEKDPTNHSVAVAVVYHLKREKVLRNHLRAV